MIDARTTEELVSAAAELLQQEAWVRIQAGEAALAIDDWQGKRHGLIVEADRLHREYEECVRKVILKSGAGDGG